VAAVCRLLPARAFPVVAAVYRPPARVSRVAVAVCRLLPARAFPVVAAVYRPPARVSRVAVAVCRLVAVDAAVAAYHLLAAVAVCRLWAVVEYPPRCERISRRYP